MTGKELIIYILENDLEDEEIFADGKPTGFMTVGEVAMEFNVGAATVLTWLNLGYLDCIVLGDMIYIPYDFEKFKLEDINIE